MLYNSTIQNFIKGLLNFGLFGVKNAMIYILKMNKGNSFSIYAEL